MAGRKVVSRVEQVAELLRQGIIDGRWRETLPGRARLAVQLGCSHGTVETAMRQLIDEGWLVSEGQGHSRRIEVPEGASATRRKIKRVRFLLYDKPSAARADEIRLLARMLESGYAADFAQKSLQDLGMDVARVARFVAKKPCDAWIVCSGSREILEWFSRQAVPTMALFGRFSGLPIAATGPRAIPAMQQAVQRLVELGHRRIVMLTNPERISPHPALFEQAFLDELQRAGLTAGSYNLPTIEERSGSLRPCLKSLFQLTPPTAILLSDDEYFLGTYHFLARRGLRVPEDVSLVSPAHVAEFRWCDPPISHLYWETDPLIRYVLRWLDRLFEGKHEIRQQLYNAEFVEGGTIGPAQK